MHILTKSDTAVVPLTGKNTRYVGFVNVRKTIYNNTVSAVDTRSTIEGKNFWSFSFLAAQSYFQDYFGEDFLADDIFAENYPLAENLYKNPTKKPFYIDFTTYKNPTTKKDEQPFPEISFKDVYSLSGTDADFFAGKMVLIGATDSTLNDVLETPQGNVPGVYVHAQAINTLLHNRLLFLVDATTELGIILIYLLFFLIVILQVKSPLLSLGIFIGNTALFFGIYLYTFLYFGGIYSHGVEFLVLNTS